ncbi:NfeD family protein [Geoglobus acetivorans]|uniref:Membrane-bound ClpP-class protease n=1 Tax=Geoglobus acetivorans TaxID=565033 RepID=A0A0A7GD44_GEOAI|nr:membrane-bound ClpP-class protease [Geoglobus acetivorans]
MKKCLYFLLALTLLTQVSGAQILEVRIDGTINEGTYLTLQSAFTKAEEENFDAILVLINTPGGLVSSTEKIVSLILNSEIPVLAYVPPGAFCASAGSLIAVSANVLGMSNGTSIGAATPISIGVTDQKVEQKTVNYLAKYAKSIAEKRDRNETAIEKFVTEAYTASAKEAYDYGIIDILADSRDEFLENADGMVVVTASGERVLKLSGEEIVVFEKPANARIYEVLSSPELASILLIIGIYALVFGLTSPGMGAEIVGVVSLILALFGLGVININYLGALLILLGIVLFVAEMVTPTYGVLGAASVICIVLGILTLYEEPLMPKDFYRGFYMLAGGIALGLGGVVTYAMIKIVQLKNERKKVGAEALIGERGEVLSFSNGKGVARIHGELWNIESDDVLERGDAVEVIEREGLKLRVKKA